ncbi:uncharacterized protein LOC127871986 [Dreissena polymorpha]|uniref:Uncharacterized protein n=1 Tax=Dreissena polymorpha TaxID=45954 RepID=A0A9D4RSV5_DREPO|nr:uncharacterized protein LOC127871986 [Dreissena polymorpha]KAH3877515.1 hypothetical protein DPMN_001388 [Dreissena polymorpha]
MILDGFDESYSGKWRQVKQEGLDAFLAANGLNFVIRKFVLLFNTTMELTREGDSKVKVVMKTGKTIEAVMDFSQEYEGDDGFDNKIMVKATWEPSTKKMIAETTPIEGSKAKRSIVEKSLMPDDNNMMLEVMILPDDKILCKRYFMKESMP